MPNTVKKLIRSIVYNNDLFFKAYFKWIFKPKNKLDSFLNSYSKNLNEPLTFIQIGANDGLRNDPLYKYIRRDSWFGILVEPQVDAFQKLKDNYKGFRGLIFENAAITEFIGISKLYKIAFTNARWASGLSSFRKEEIQRMIDAGYVERMAKRDSILLPKDRELWIETEDVITLSFCDLVEKHKIKNLDLLMLDVEGYEFEIKKTIPFDKIFIKAIIYELTHYNEEMKNNISNFLIKHGYEIRLADSDAIAIKIN